MITSYLSPAIIQSFSIRYNTESGFVFDISSANRIPGYRPGNNVGCILHKFTFSSPENPITYSPRFPGSCQIFSEQSRVLAMMDDRDTLHFILAGFADEAFTTSRASIILTLNANSREDPFPIQLSFATVALAASGYSYINNQLLLNSFDFYPSQGIVNAHFSGFVDLNTFNASFITFLNVEESPTVMYSLSYDWNTCSPYSIARTVCIELSQTDIANMTSAGVCTNATNCFLSWETNATVTAPDGTQWTPLDSSIKVDRLRTPITCK